MELTRLKESEQTGNHHGGDRCRIKSNSNEEDDKKEIECAPPSQVDYLE